MMVTKHDVWSFVAPGFEDKTRYTLYVSPGSQISHIATNQGNIKRQYLLHNVLVKEKYPQSKDSGKLTLIFW